MKAGIIVSIIGVVLAMATGVFMLDRAIAAGSTLESMFPSLLVLAFAVIGVWGGVAPTPKQRMRASLGAALGGLVIAGLYFIPAALALVVAAVINGRLK